MRGRQQRHRRGPDLATLDRVDEIVAPGVTIGPADTSYGEQVLKPEPLRR